MSESRDSARRRTWFFGFLKSQFGKAFTADGKPGAPVAGD
ncbi:hypothetical protein FHS62_002366 [Amphiplicatus metriothermophilus]|nr:hypothetical protein [Amphiplicatus metriothermophilus]